VRLTIAPGVGRPPSKLTTRNPQRRLPGVAANSVSNAKKYARPTAANSSARKSLKALAAAMGTSLERSEGAYVLGLSHAVNIAFFTALAESGETVPKLADISSTTFDAQLQIAGRVAEENPHLYFAIQAENPFGLAALEELQAAVTRIATVVRTGDEAGFVRLMEQGRSYLAKRR